MPIGRWTPPDAGPNAPARLMRILAEVYRDCRDRWAKEHPGDIENKENKAA